jgi:hypothetical protein
MHRGSNANDRTEALLPPSSRRAAFEPQAAGRCAEHFGDLPQSHDTNHYRHASAHQDHEASADDPWLSAAEEATAEELGRGSLESAAIFPSRQRGIKSGLFLPQVR